MGEKSKRRDLYERFHGHGGRTKRRMICATWQTINGIIPLT